MLCLWCCGVEMCYGRSVKGSGVDMYKEHRRKWLQVHIRVVNRQDICGPRIWVEK